jgi:hypothetical protein
MATDVPALPVPPARLLFSNGALITITIGAAIAAVVPYDKVFGLVTLGSPILRVLLLVTLSAIGLVFAQRIGATITPHDLAHPITTPLLIGAAAAVALTVLDALTPTALLSIGYAHFISSIPLAVRFIYFMTRAFNENILYRLFLTSTLAWGIGRASGHRTQRPSGAVFLAAAVLAQCVNIGTNVVIHGGPFTAAQATYDVVRYVTPGVLWAYLYGTRGFVSAEIASVGCHLFFQPLLGLVFLHG